MLSISARSTKIALRQLCNDGGPSSLYDQSTRECLGFKRTLFLPRRHARISMKNTGYYTSYMRGYALETRLDYSLWACEFSILVKQYKCLFQVYTLVAIIFYEM